MNDIYERAVVVIEKRFAYWLGSCFPLSQQETTTAILHFGQCFCLFGGKFLLICRVRDCIMTLGGDG